MSWFDFIHRNSPLVFSPKVTPDPNASERLSEKLQMAMQKLDQAPQATRTRRPLRIVGDEPSSKASSRS